MQEFRIGRALGLSFKAWFRNFIPFTLLAGVLYAPVFIWMAVAEPSYDSTGEDLVNHVLMYPVYAMVAASTLVAPMLTYRVIQELNGARVSMLTSVKFGLRGILPALILAAVANVLQLLPAGGILSSIIMCFWFVCAPAAVVEQLNPFAALSRSATLTQGRRWGIFGLLFLIGIIQVIMLAAWIVPMFASFDGLARIESAAYGFIGTMCVFQLFIGIVAAVSYALLRQDKDGVTHEELARIFE